MEIIVLSAGVFLTVIVGWLALQGERTRDARLLARRLAEVRTGRRRNAVQAKAVDLRRDDGGKGLDKVISRLVPRVSGLRVRLGRTGRKISVAAYLSVSVLLAVAVAVTGYVVVKLPPATVVLAGLGLGLLLPHLAVGMMIKGRQARFNNLFPDAIDLMVRGLRSGLPVSECLKAVGRELPDPVGPEFQRITDAVKFGSQIDTALWDAAKRLDMAEFKFFVVSLSVQQETGGNLAETLANLSDILRRRKQMRLKIKAMSSEAKASAMILGSLPFIMFCIIYAMNPGYESLLFTDPRGRAILAAGLLTMASGIFVMSRMVRFEI